ncbi:hypothetical protein BKA82DRAFT_2596476 [Pisolithus tinctorius]|nr:hypothetical protein BKA82DRAFT_2596476 [Pisolithus tinctorius]
MSGQGGHSLARVPAGPRTITLSLCDVSSLSSEKGYTLDVKLVRSAYHPHEIASHIRSLHTMSVSTDPDSPVYSSKVETDGCYNTCVSAIGASELVPQELVKKGLGREKGGVDKPRTIVIPREVVERCSMEDSLTNHIVARIISTIPCVMKHTPRRVGSCLTSPDAQSRTRLFWGSGKETGWWRGAVN